MTPLVLASTSPARRALMDALGVPYEAVAPGVDEEVPEGTPVEKATALLARRKAEAVRRLRPDALVLGADQLVELDGVALGKPPDEGAALRQLRSLSGRTHRIVTAVCLLGPGVELEERGQALFEDIQGDRTSVQGLPMLRVVRMLRRAGVF